MIQISKPMKKIIIFAMPFFVAFKLLGQGIAPDCNDTTVLNSFEPKLTSCVIYPDSKSNEKCFSKK